MNIIKNVIFFVSRGLGVLILSLMAMSIIALLAKLFYSVIKATWNLW